MRKGIHPDANVAQQPTQSSTPPSIGSNSSNQRIGKQLPPRREAPSRLVQPLRGNSEERSLLILSSSGLPVGGMRRGLVAPDGTPTVIAAADPKACTEKCPRCAKMVPPNAMRTLIQNVERPSNPVRVCAGCAEKVFKDPRNSDEKWQFQMPVARFDQETGKPYSTRERGVNEGFIINRDTFHTRDELQQREREAARAGVHVPLQDGFVAGQWSGGGQVGRQVGSRRR